jgi:hypothetical protein
VTVIYVASAPAIPEIRPSSTPPESTVAKSEVNPVPLESAAPVEIQTGRLSGPSLPAQSDPFDRAEKARLCSFNSSANEIPRQPEAVLICRYPLLLFQFASVLRLT